MPPPDENEQEADRRPRVGAERPTFDTLTFTGQKFALLDALSMDAAVSPAEFRIAYRLLQHANARTGLIFPSQVRIAAQVNGSPRWVRKCISRLEEIGWLEFERENRHRTNQYRFCPTRIAEVMENAKARVAALRQARDGAEAAEATEDINDSAGTIDPLPTGTIDPLPSGTIVPLNNLKQHETRTQEHFIFPQPEGVADAGEAGQSSEKGFVQELVEDLLREDDGEK